MELAKVHSDCTSKSSGGKIGNEHLHLMTLPFSTKAISLKINEVSEVLKSEYGFHVIKKTGDSAPFGPPPNFVPATPPLKFE